MLRPGRSTRWSSEIYRGSLLRGVLPVAKAEGYLLARGEVKLL
jgi:hypothetical protein